MVHISGFNLMVVTETKVANQQYCHNRLGYKVVCSLVITTRITGVSGPGRLVRTKGIERQVDALPQAENGELRCPFQRKTDPTHWCVPLSLHPGLLTGLG